jgi:2-phosphosulfolactate phosphatase
LARITFEGAEKHLEQLVRDSVSGRELADRGFEVDVDIALETGSSEAVPILKDGAYIALQNPQGSL